MYLCNIPALILYAFRNVLSENALRNIGDFYHKRGDFIGKLVRYTEQRSVYRRIENGKFRFQYTVPGGNKSSGDERREDAVSFVRLFAENRGAHCFDFLIESVMSEKLTFFNHAIIFRGKPSRLSPVPYLHTDAVEMMIFIAPVVTEKEAVTTERKCLCLSYRRAFFRF